MKKVCFVVNDLTVFGGAERVAVGLANGLCRDYQVSILSLNRSGDQMPFSCDPSIQIDFIFDGFHRIRELVIRGTSKVRSYFKKNKIDVALAIGTTEVLPCAFAALGLKTKVVFCDHGALENQLDERIPTLERKLGSKLSDQTITLTEYTKHSYQKYFHTPEHKIDFIYNCIDDALFEHQAEYDVTSKKLLSVGRISSEKGFDMLLKVARKVFEKHSDWSWDIYGDGEEAQSVRQAACDLGLQNNLIFHGNVSDMYARYAGHAMLVLTSYREGLPLALLEAKANRLPIVSFDVVTGPGEILTDGVDGFLIPCYEIDRMAQVICNLIQDDELRVRLSDNYQNRMEQFRSRTILDQWKAVIDRF